MAIAIAIVVIVVGTVVFHFMSPWWLTPLASNWKQMDDTLAITLGVTGIFFVVLNLFMVYSVIRFRHRAGRRAAYEPENKKTERWLIVGTTIGIIALLAPGLFVYAEYVSPPQDAIYVEALSQQWQWRFRFPGEGGKFGASDARFVNQANPFGLDPADPASQANVLVNSNEVHLPLGKPVRMLLRSHDVLHDFYVPQFRARMNIVPGMMTTFWFTPTKAGRYEILCAQLCGIGHFNMRGHVVVEDEASFRRWLTVQPTYAMMAAGAKAGGTAFQDQATGAASDAGLAKGKALAQSKGCVACHTADGASGVGPTWKGLAHSTRQLSDGSSVTADDAYLKRSIREPLAQVVKGFPPAMPKIEMTDDEVNALVEYIKSLGGPAQGAAATKQPQAKP
jgi:cytochrome c oxidase subunit 2